MKILYMITTSEFGGATKNVYYLAKHFAIDNEVHVVAGDSKWLADEEVSAGYIFHCLPEIVKPISPLKDLLAVFQTVRLMRKIRPDLVHCHSSKAGLIARISARLLKIPVIFTAHGWSTLNSYGRLKTFIYYAIEKFAAYVTDCMICIGIDDFKFAKENFACKHFELMHNGIPDSECLVTDYNTSDELKLCMVARFAHPKTPDVVVKALELLKQRGVVVQLTFIGDGPDIDKMRADFDRSPVAGQLCFFGETADVEHELLKYDVFVLSTKWEGLPISIIEAMRAGLPVVASAVGGNSDLVVDKVTGYLFESGNSAQLAQLLDKINGNRTLLHEFGVNGRKRYLELFSEARMLTKAEKIYHKVLA